MFRRRPPALATATVVATALTAALAGPATAAGPPTYVALGDSYSSGTGTRSYLPDGTGCLRSTYAYPSLLASARGWALHLQACSGATTADVVAHQLGALHPTTTYVTLTAGGNDAGFRDVLTTCAEPAWLSDCGGAVDRAQAFVQTRLPARLAALYAAVRVRAPRARVVVVGYPRVFSGVDCNALTWFSPGELARLDATADLVDTQLAAAAAAAGFAFSDPRVAFTGHAVCSPAEWINGLSFPVTDSYHPNRSGHALGLAPVVGRALPGPAVSASAALRRALARTPSAAAPGSDPEAVGVPDLTTPRARAAAARAGVDLASRASIDAADARWATAQETAHAR